MEFIFQVSSIQSTVGRDYVHMHSNDRHASLEQHVRIMMGERKSQAVSVNEIRSLVANMKAASMCITAESYWCGSKWYPWRLCLGVARSIATQRQRASSGLYLLGSISVDDDTSPVIIPPEEGAKRC